MVLEESNHVRGEIFGCRYQQPLFSFLFESAQTLIMANHLVGVADIYRDQSSHS
jgi:hypothetical protein|tara:strand:- start:127112 stop:127273 length:162 start_codon:yes stop_codon:yes gene_type:complete